MGEQVIGVDAQLIKDLVEFLEGADERVRERQLLFGVSPYDQFLVMRAEGLVEQLQAVVARG